MQLHHYQVAITKIILQTNSLMLHTMLW